jgi:hypothetical protein
MSLQPLITGQVLRIDNNHQRGTNTSVDWGKGDIHIDKYTNFKVNGKLQRFIIKLPINSDREYTIKGIKNTHVIPERIKKEVAKALGNANIRTPLVWSLIECLKEASLHGIEEKAGEALDHLAKHFELHWTGEEIKRYISAALVSHTKVYKSNDNKEFYEKITKQKNSGKATLEIGENSGYAKKTNRIGR